ncbi:MAG: thiamine pyrophosphate-dependent enzyme [Planctomycetota bacterium]|jgi:pyruvate ferredoxin oxidoreductase beta subunit/2-oxoisovalerate ferredoxin oxidoreductase beta subunit|nr:2-ketoisovalerate ferredoxin oxidoreductase [Planctomycetota bacterium]MDP6520955.1 thiamine pyrophosphate-dependent enzyme [Planctomycetota bacterium]MDP6955237.1 thiamine pyrophosphate-dependent enzyme [Planctomycetota bacterium]
MAEPILKGEYQSEVDRSEPILRAGNTNCGGCGMSVAYNMLSLAAAKHQLQFVIPACCGIVTPGQFPYSAYGAPVVASTFAAAAATASGLAATAQMNGEDTRVVCWAGDGGTYDIGMATVSAAAERNEDILYVCYDNEIYGNTGGQRSSATPLGAATTTTPAGKDIGKKDILAIMAAHRVPYAASISLGHADDAVDKFKKALNMSGFRFLHILAPCPTGWKSEAAEGIGLIRLAVSAGLFQVFEVWDGQRFEISIEPEFSRSALKSYMEKQGRFKEELVDLDAVEQAVRNSWDILSQRAKMSS